MRLFDFSNYDYPSLLLYYRNNIKPKRKITYLVSSVKNDYKYIDPIKEGYEFPEYEDVVYMNPIDNIITDESVENSHSDTNAKRARRVPQLSSLKTVINDDDYSSLPYKLTSDFGLRVAPTNGASTDHKGMDFSMPLNTALKSPSGKWLVKRTGYDDKAGNFIVLENVNTKNIIKYLHLNSINVFKNSVITGGDIIGLSGNSGTSTAPHVDLRWLNKDGGTYSRIPASIAQEIFS